ncbi:MAG: hypothetical protein KBC48_00095 [Candidatus Pacebacteria bacterium]|nr:hypothetical protein [Candidatus Paceibacterota bacterium]
MQSYLYLPTYVIWHYTAGLKAAGGLALNFIRFTANFFSLQLLLKTLFSPWRRLGEHYVSGLHPSEWLSTFLVNTLMRIVGAIIRLILIIVGLLMIMLTALGGLLMLIIWVLWPALILIAISGGLFLIFS